MNELNADMAKKTVEKASKAGKLSYESTALARCYGQIGISAVAAAARYYGGGENPPSARVQAKRPDRAGEAAT